MFRILVIDDEKQLRDNIAEILEYSGYAILKGEHGAMGLQLAQTYLPDLIICDVMMPGLDGYAVIEELQSDPTTAVIPFLFLTAKADHESRRHAMQLGADDYLTKPFAPEELLSAVRSRLEKRAIMSQQFEQQFNELRGNLISVLPHELRTPLSSILGYTDFILMDYETLDKHEIERMVQSIARSGKRLQRVIENYLLYAQVEIQRYDRQTAQAVSQQHYETPGMLIRDVVRQTARTLDRDNDVTVQTEDVTVQISGDMLKKIVEEIVGNAFKFSEPGKKISIRAEQRGEGYSIQVSDQGRGMTAEQMSRVGAYMQFERKLYEQQGMGLGLILAKRLTEIHGGDLTITSEPGQGTTVHVQLQVTV